MAELKRQVEMLTSFIAPIYENLLNSSNEKEAKKNTVGILTDHIKTIATKEGTTDLYTLLPVISLLTDIVDENKKKIENVDGFEKVKQANDLHKYYSSLLKHLNILSHKIISNK